MGHPLTGEVARLIQDSSTRAAEGVLLSVSAGRVTSQSLRIDAKKGAIKTAGAVRRFAKEGVVALTRRSTVATLPVQALQMYGTRSVFATLPVSTLVPGAKASIALRRPGRFTAPRAGSHRCDDHHGSRGDQGSRDADALLGRVQELPADGGAAGRLGAVIARRELPDRRQRRRSTATGESCRRRSPRGWRRCSHSAARPSRGRTACCHTCSSAAVSTKRSTPVCAI